MPTILEQPHGQRLGDYLLEQLGSNEWTSFRAAIAFVKVSGVAHLEQALAAFSQRAHVCLSIGVSLRGTSKEGLERLAAAIGSKGEVWIFFNEKGLTFHPKMYLFSNPEQASLVVGSGNLTEGGLFDNYEASLEIPLNLANESDRRTYDEAVAVLDRWQDERSGLAHRLTPEFLLELVQEGYVPPERLATQAEELPAPTEQREREAGEERPTRRKLFGSVAVPAPPALPEAPQAIPAPAPPTGEAPTTAATRTPTPAPAPTESIPAAPAATPPAAAGAQAHVGFVMTLHTTDVGYGQTTPGTQRRSPEIFIPLAARDADTDFWEWDHAYTPDPGHAGKRDRVVTLRIGADLVEATFYNWPDKHDFRIRTESLRAGATVGDILRLEKSAPNSGFDYYAEIVPQGTVMFPTYLSLCTNTVRNSVKLWGYY